jgi:hypothetical protein
VQAAVEIDEVGGFATVLGPEGVRAKGVDDVPALLLVSHHPGVVQDTDVV